VIPVLVYVASLRSPQHARPQEVEVSAPMHLPLEGFQAIDLPLYRTITLVTEQYLESVSHVF
jgi:hypothetical protein